MFFKFGRATETEVSRRKLAFEAKILLIKRGAEGYNKTNLLDCPGPRKNMSKHQELLQEFRQFAATAPSTPVLMARISQRLHDQMARYNWVGFYLVDRADPGVLVVGPYVGSFSPNVRIPINKGLCGAAATTRQTVVVNDVANDPRYLSGSEIVKANMVVPIMAKNVLVAELDIESYFAHTFTKPEQTFAEEVAALVGKFMEKKT
jgi:L-methionine (R)-S-oxide reductase